jgi:peptidyl-tRNA hydrolase
MKKSLIFIGVSFLALVFQLSLSSAAIAEDKEMETLINEVCDHVVMCMKKEVEESEDEISPRMLKMIDSMSKSTCQSLTQYTLFVDQSGITVDDVKQCYKAMANTECGVLTEQEDIPACKVLEDKLDAS